MLEGAHKVIKDRLEHRIETKAAEVRELLKVAQAMWVPGEPGDIESWIKRVQAIKIN